MTLIDKLATLTDTRPYYLRTHKLEVVLMLDIMGKLAGYNGILAKGEFIKKHKVVLNTIFKGRIKRWEFPSPNTFTRVKAKVNFAELNQILFDHFSDLNPDTSVIHLDGKSIRSSVKNENGKQTFDAIVTAFNGQLALSSKHYQNGKESEIEMFREMITLLGLTDTLFTGDALHCQKKQ
jgi:DDE_Tnp_1-associated